MVQFAVLVTLLRVLLTELYFFKAIDEKERNAAKSAPTLFVIFRETLKMLRTYSYNVSNTYFSADRDRFALQLKKEIGEAFILSQHFLLF